MFVRSVALKGAGVFYNEIDRADILAQRVQKHSIVVWAVLGPSALAWAQRDPGPRGGSLGAGGPYPTLSKEEVRAFTDALETFSEIDSVSGGIERESGNGLGPTFNANSCAACHAEPAVGGSSPHPNLGFVPQPNPQVALATLDRLPGREQIVPSFIRPDGPVREARFVFNPDGSREGGVHGLYTIAGRMDAAECYMAQPNFARELSRNNVIFRIPTGVFGLGLVENVSEEALVANFARNVALKRSLGIGGHFNRSGNDGTITRFGWKAQNKSLLVFAGEAYNVEQGVTNELFPNERSAAPGCQYNPTPEDVTNVLEGKSSDVTQFAVFMRLTAPPTPTTSRPSELRGQSLFGTSQSPGIGCVLCHSDTLTTAESSYTGMSHVDIHPYSDFAVHGMGVGLADGVQQGNSGYQHFRTAPLWGVGQRIFFLHDGRAGPSNGGLVTAILQHESLYSEANAVIGRYRRLSTADKQAIVDFLRSL